MSHLMNKAQPVVEALMFINLTQMPKLDTIEQFLKFSAMKTQFLELLHLFWQKTDLLKLTQLSEVVQDILRLPRLNVLEINV